VDRGKGVVHGSGNRKRRGQRRWYTSYRRWHCGHVECSWCALTASVATAGEKEGSAVAREEWQPGGEKARQPQDVLAQRGRQGKQTREKTRDGLSELAR